MRTVNRLYVCNDFNSAEHCRRELARSVNYGGITINRPEYLVFDVCDIQYRCYFTFFGKPLRGVRVDEVYLDCGLTHGNMVGFVEWFQFELMPLMVLKNS